MKRRLILSVLLQLIVLPKVAAASEEAVFALIVTNNRSYSMSRPDLQYADDDGVRYRDFFGMVTAPEHISLLTRLDEPTRRLYPALAETVRPPRSADFLSEITRISAAVEAAKAQHKRTVFYFVFAGHGHVKGGKGFLELEDGRIGPEDIETKILDRIEADTVHVVLDSCNSFFVINPRKPGGKRWATPRDMTRGFAKRYPHVGVVLSTNSAAEVYEWSEIASGIFSHEIRSGMSGAADANADRQVSYDEIDAYVATANLGIKNEAYVPKVYIRGPHDNGSSSFLNLRGAKGRTLRIGAAERRLWIRDAAGVRLADLRKENGAPLTLVLPAADDAPLYIQEEHADANGRPVLRQYIAPPDTHTDLDTLEQEELRIAARGQDEVFRMIFAVAYGPDAFEAHLHRKREAPETIFGISEADQRRMAHYLGELARADRQKRYIWGGLSAAVGAVFGVAGALVISEKERDLDEILLGSISLTSSGLLLGIGAYQLISPSRGETAFETFKAEVKQTPRSRSESVVAETELLLEEISQREKKKRLWTASMLYLLGAASIGGGIFVYVHRDIEWDDEEVKGMVLALTSTMGIIDIGLGITQHFIDTPSERMLRLYRQDPDLSITVGLAPVRGGATAGISFRF